MGSLDAHIFTFSLSDNFKVIGQIKTTGKLFFGDLDFEDVGRGGRVRGEVCVGKGAHNATDNVADGGRALFKLVELDHIIRVEFDALCWNEIGVGAKEELISWVRLSGQNDRILLWEQVLGIVTVPISSNGCTLVYEGDFGVGHKLPIFKEAVAQTA